MFKKALSSRFLWKCTRSRKRQFPPLRHLMTLNQVYGPTLSNYTVWQKRKLGRRQFSTLQQFEWERPCANTSPWPWPQTSLCLRPKYWRLIMIQIVLLSQKIVQIFKSDFRQFPVDLLPIRMPIWWFSKLHRAFHWFILSGCKLAIASNCYQLPRHHCKISAKTLLDLGSKLDFVKSKDGRWDMTPRAFLFYHF